MEKGEKYLDIKIVGHDFIRAFPNKEKTKETQPDFKADGVAVWIREVKDKPAETIKPNLIKSL